MRLLKSLFKIPLLAVELVFGFFGAITWVVKMLIYAGIITLGVVLFGRCTPSPTEAPITTTEVEVKPEHFLRQAPRDDIMVLDLPFTPRNLRLEHISRGCYDGVQERYLAEVSEVWDDYLPPITYGNIQTMVNAYKGYIDQELKMNYQILDNHPWADKLQILSDDLKAFLPRFKDIPIKVVIIKNLDGSPYHNAHVVPGTIAIGASFLDFLLIEGGVEGVLETIAHELGHLASPAKLQSSRESMWKEQVRSKYGQIAGWVADKAVDVIEEPFQKRSELYADYIGIWLLNETRRVDLFQALKPMQKIAKIKEAQDPFYTSFFSTHPNSVLRVQCLEHLIISHTK